MALVAAFALLAAPAIAAPVRITCNGTGLDPTTGRQAIAGVMTFGFEFDQDSQSMTMADGRKPAVTLSGVSVTDGMARGTDGKWLFEVNRIDGTATTRLAPQRNESVARLPGFFYRGTCAAAGTARF